MNNKINFIFDFDSTLVKTESLNDILTLSLGNNKEKIQQLEQLTKLAMEGKLSFKESLEKRLTLSTITKSMINNIINKTLDEITDNIESVIKNIYKYDNTNIYIVSGGFVDVIEPIAKKLNIKSNNIYANKFIFNNQNEVIGIENTLLLQECGKAKVIQDLKDKNLINGKTIMIGDGYTDLETYLTKAVDKYICFCGVIARQSVIEKSQIIANNVQDLIDICTKEINE